MKITRLIIECRRNGEWICCANSPLSDDTDTDIATITAHVRAAFPEARFRMEAPKVDSFGVALFRIY